MADKTGEIDLNNRDPNGLNDHLGLGIFHFVAT
jgi:hypothetical protein